jgi:hypothetical protein
MKTLPLFLIIALTVILFSGCFPHQGPEANIEPAGFFTGIWHGWIAPFSLIVGLFDGDVVLYARNNTGWWYDLGFYMAVISGFGGLAFTRRTRNDQHR